MPCGQNHLSEHKAMFNIHILILKLYADSLGARRSLHTKHLFLYGKEGFLCNKSYKTSIPYTPLSCCKMKTDITATQEMYAFLESMRNYPGRRAYSNYKVSSRIEDETREI